MANKGRMSRLTKLYMTLYGAWTLIEIHPDDGHYTNKQLVGQQFVPTRDLGRGGKWVSGLFMFLYPSKGNSSSRYFYRARFMPYNLTSTRRNHDGETGDVHDGAGDEDCG